jgi:hypothetical protein
MKLITERPMTYDLLNNFELRSAFEDEENEPILFTHLKAEGYVGGNTSYGKGDMWAIDQYDEDGVHITYSFLYDSEAEYLEDVNLLKL